jgi:potassium efflux system protein
MNQPALPLRLLIAALPGGLALALALLAGGALAQPALDARTQQPENSALALPAPPPSLEQWRAAIPSDASVATLERLLAQEHSRHAQLRQTIESLTTQITNAIAQPDPGNGAIDSLRQRLQNTPPAATADAASAPAAARQQQPQPEITARALEPETASERQNQLETQLQAARHALALIPPRIAWLSQRIAQLERQRLQQQSGAMNALAAQYAKEGDGDAATPLAALARRNAVLAGQLLDNTEQLALQRQQQAMDEQRREQITAILRDAQTRLTLSGNNAAIGQWLWQQRLALPSIRSLQLRRTNMQQQLSQLRLYQYTLSDWQQASENAAAPAPSDATELARWNGANAQQHSLLEQMIPLVARRVSTFEQSDRTLAALIERGDALRALMDRELLRVPTHTAINLEWLQSLGATARALGSGVQPVAMAHALCSDIQSRAALYLCLALIVLLLFRLRLRAATRLKTLAEYTRHAAQDRFAYTSEALGWSILLALPWPATAWLTGALLGGLNAGRVNDIEALGATLTAISGPGMALALLRALIRPDGIAGAHLHWLAARLARLRHTCRLVCLIVLPAGFLAWWALFREVDQATGVYARLAILFIALGMGATAHWLLRRERPWPDISERAFAALRLLAPAAFLAVAALVSTGYVYAGMQLLISLLRSALVVALVQIAFDLIARWMLLRERSMLGRQRASAAPGRPEVADLEAGEQRKADDDAMELVSVSAQSHRLLRMLRLALLLAGLAWAWQSVLPAFMQLDALVLWHFTGQDAAGNAAVGAVTAADLALGVLLLAITFSLSRNVPGLIELLFSQRLPVSASTRYTVSTLARYGIVIVGALMACALLGLRWSQLQWLAAALTVGLGFGLQEIFANFVSGLILLVERPFRVGDTITINSVSGIVTRIRTRATVVQDWDNKEVIIPNKTFITGQVVNWTLSDDITRLVIPLGVACGSPIERVHALLVQAAREQEGVLPEPPPRSWFMAFGNSTLNFELRVFVCGPGARLAVQNELLARIARLFAAEGIELPPPQMDIHIREWPAQTPTMPGGVPDQTAAPDKPAPPPPAN